MSYYPFGMVMPGRNWNAASAGEYRFGFQSQEIENEILNGAVVFSLRIEDPRTGRFFSIDPLAPKYASNSPYSFSQNSVISFIELEGAETAILRLPRSLPWLELTFPKAPTIPYPPILPFPPDNIRYEKQNKPIYPAIESDVNWSEPPLSPEELSGDWTESTSPKNKTGDHRTFENKKTGEKIRFDKGEPDAVGNSKFDH